MRLRRLWSRKDRAGDADDLAALVERVQEAVSTAARALDGAAAEVRDRAERSRRGVDASELRDAADADARVRDALDRIAKNGDARIEWLRQVADARQQGIESTQRVLTVLLETALRKPS